MSLVLAGNVLVKQPGEDLTFTMDFSNLLETGETITSVDGVTSGPAGLTLGSPTINGSTIQFKIDGGTDGVKYLVEVTVTTSLSNVRIGDGELLVKD